MKVGIDSYCYHRYFGEVYPDQGDPGVRWTFQDFVNRAAELEVDGVSLDQVSDERAAAIHPELKGDWRQVFVLKTAMAKRRGIGMPGPVRVAGEIRRWRRTLGAD